MPVPKPVLAALQDAQRSEQAGRGLDAADDLAHVVEMQPWRLDLLEKTGKLYFEGGDWENAASLLQSAQEQGVLSDQGSIDLGEAYFQSGQYDLALTVWMELLSGQETTENLYVRIIDMQASMGRYLDQVAVYRQWVAKEPENAQACYRLGLLLAVQDPAGALMILNLAKTLDPALDGTAGVILQALSGLQDADERYRLVITGRALGSIGEWGIARQAFQQAVDLDPDYGEAWAFLAESQQQLGMPALQALETANRLAPDSVGVKALSALFWRRQNDPHKALQFIEEIRALQPDEEVWLVEMGNLVAQTGDLEAALAYFQQAVAAEPENPLWLSELIGFCLQNDYQVRALALPAARAYLLMENESVQALDMMGWVMLALKDTLSARRYLTRALEGDSLNASIHLHLGQALLLENEPDQAYEQLAAAIRLGSQQPDIAVLAERLLERYFPGRISTQP